MQEKKGKGPSRRDIIRSAGAAAVLGAAAGASAAPGDMTKAPRPPRAFSRQAEVPGFGKARVVIVGGGWSGLEVARQLKKLKPELDVVLIEKRATFFSCPLSNLWLVGKLPLEELIHSYTDAARNHDYTWLHAAVVDVDRERRVIYTDEGWLTYDFLVLAPGIDYDYARYGVPDATEAARLRSMYPAAFKPGSEHITLRHKLENFEEGIFLLTVPPGNYRCLPAPYERACMIAGYMKENDIKGKVLLLDVHDEPPFKPDGINEAINDLYKDHIEIVRGVKVMGIDVSRRTLHTNKGDITFDDAAIYPPVRGAKILERIGIAKTDEPGLFAHIDPVKYHVIGDERVFVGGDARPMPFVKAGFAANYEAGHIARIITNQMDGKEMGPLQSPGMMCYVAVNADPLQSVAFKISFGMVYDRKTGGYVFRQTAQAFVNRSRAFGKANLQWGRSLFNEMFYSAL